MIANPPITGTFLNPMAGDIVANHWGAEEWREQFRVFRAMQMDTLVLIRAVTSQRAIYPTRTAQGLTAPAFAFREFSCAICAHA